MPNRIIKESICTSDTIEQLTDKEEVFFYRLIVNCDDYGRFDARSAILKSRLFPLDNSITNTTIEKILHRLSTLGLVILYEYENKPYLKLTTWEKHQQVRNKKSKYPSPEESNILTDDFNCNQLKSNDCKCPRNPIQSESNPKQNPKTKEPSFSPVGETVDFLEYGFSEAMESKIKEWMQYKREKRQAYQPTGLKNFLKQMKNSLEKYAETDLIHEIDTSMANNWQGIQFNRLKGKEKPYERGKGQGTSENSDNGTDYSISGITVL